MWHYIRIGMVLLQPPLGTPSNDSPILCRISEHVQDALLTKLLGQTFEIHNS